MIGLRSRFVSIVSADRLRDVVDAAVLAEDPDRKEVVV
jgi:hypothetical protein